MSAYGLIDQYAKKIQKYSTPISHAWWTVNFVLRMFIVTTIGNAVYGDEQGVFRCDTSQPGCNQMCFNRFSPINHPRFWGFQILFCCLPSVIFIFITANQEAQMKKIENQEKEIKEKYTDSDYTSTTEYTKIDKKKKKLGLEKKKVKTTTDMGGLSQVIWTPQIRMWYVAHLIAKFFLEIIFIYLYYLLQKQQSKQSGFAAWYVPEKYVCTHGAEMENFACSQNAEIPCWVSRPWEKMMMMWYMLSISVLSAVLALVELVWVLTRISVKAKKVRRARKLEKKSLLSPAVPLLENGESGDIVKEVDETKEA